MANTFAASLALCGIDHRAAAAYLEQPVERIEAWCIDASGVPMSVWNKLGWLYQEVITGCDAATDVIQDFGLPPNWQNDFSMGGAQEDAPQGASAASGAMAILTHLMMQNPAPARHVPVFDWGMRDREG